MVFDGVVRGVFVRRPMSCTTFKEAKADVLKTFAATGIATGQRALELTKDWPDDAPYGGRSRPSLFAGYTDYANGIEYTVNICPNVSGGWYYHLIISVADGKPPASTQPSSASISPSN
jgi:hypothetical protein